MKRGFVVGTSCVAWVLSAIVGGSALASDGVIEISQACVAGGCFAGDAGGWPVTIGTTGSYRLTSNLTVPDANTSAIDMTVGGIALDLNQFGILGSTSCTSCPATSCTGTGSGRGIYNSVAFAGRSVTVRNGAIRGMGAAGISISTGNLALVDVTISSNGGSGVSVVGGGAFAFRSGAAYNGGDGLNSDSGAQATMQEVQTACNANEGIEVGTGSTVTNSTAVGNGGTGIYTGPASALSNNVARVNAGSGIRAIDATLIGNTSNNNGVHGFFVVGGSTVTANTAQANTSNGFFCGDGVVLSTNVARSNLGFGITLGTGSGYLANALTCNNSSGACDNAVQVSGAGFNLGSNVCGTDTTCP